VRDERRGERRPGAGWEFINLCRPHLTSCMCKHRLSSQIYPSSDHANHFAPWTSGRRDEWARTSGQRPAAALHGPQRQPQFQDRLHSLHSMQRKRGFYHI
jgi:hypothetical protein